VTDLAQGVGLDSIPTCNLEQAMRMIEAADNARKFEGEGDNFRYTENPYFLLPTSSGRFVAQILNASGGGRVSVPPDPEKDFCNASISYNLHARVLEEGGVNAS
jgi:hypothetical protein